MPKSIAVRAVVIAGALAVTFAATGLALVATGVWENPRDLLKQRYRIDGASMEPALCDGDTFTLNDFDGRLERWDLIFYRHPWDQSRTSIKRVVALPGETVDVVEGGVIRINGEPVAGDVYAAQPAHYTFEPLVVPEGRYFVLGDNRRNSADSHSYQFNDSAKPRPEGATIPADLIEGELPADFATCD